MVDEKNIKPELSAAMEVVSKLDSDSLKQISIYATKLIDTRRAEEISALRSKMEEMAASAGLSIDSILSGGKAGKSNKSGKSSAGSKVAMKYADPSNPSNLWSGRGRRPVWVQEAIEAGKSLEDLLIQPEA